MSSPDHSIRIPIRAHWQPFLVSIAVGAVLALGIRSLFFDADGSAPAAPADSSPAHHAEQGHEGHAHGQDDAPAEKPGADAHANHGGMASTSPSKAPPTKSEDPGPGTQTPTDGPAGTLLALGNELCPVMGGDVDGETFTEWNGLRVGHCCAGCTARFLKNPESLLDEVSPTWRDAAAAAKAIDAAAGAERAALITKSAKTWPVLREPTAPPPAPEPAGLLIDLGNSACPVMHGDVDGKTFTEWNGLRIGHCCAGCSKRFLKAPEELLDEVAPDWRAAAAAVEAVDGAPAAEREAKLAEIGKRWPVVREPAPPESE